MKREFPEHVLAELHRLIAEEMPAEKIAFLMRLNRKVVDAEIERFNTTGKPATATR
jgi:hypothetical protein